MELCLRYCQEKIDFYTRFVLTDDINDSASDLEKKLVSLIFFTSKTRHCSSIHYRSHEGTFMSIIRFASLRLLIIYLYTIFV